MYYRYLTELLDSGIKKIASKELAKLMNVTASQIRQDLNNFGSFGQQGFGYDIEHLIKEITIILGIDKTQNMIIIGAGNMGQALAKFPFGQKSFKVTAIFDIRKDLISTQISKDLTIENVGKMEQFIKENPTDIVALVTSSKTGAGISKILSRLPIKGIWNFTNVELNVPKEIAVVNVHLVDSLLQLAYKSNNNENSPSFS